MKLKGFKLIFEREVKNGKRHLFASKNSAPISEDVDLGEYNDVDFIGKTIYEHEGSIYATNENKFPSYDTTGKPLDTPLVDLINMKVYSGDTETPGGETIEGGDVEPEDG